MSEQEQSSSQLSALFDGELPPQQAEMVIRRALKDSSMRGSWERYALIGACLRQEPLRLTGSVADRVQAALAGERELNVSALPARSRATGTTGAPRITLFGRGALGGAIAAGVAVMSIFVVRNIAPTPGAAGAVVAQNSQSQTFVQPATGDGAPGYTTPGENSPAQPRSIDVSLGSFLVAHSEEAASALRFSYDLAEGAAEMTEDEFRALR